MATSGKGVFRVCLKESGKDRKDYNLLKNSVAVGKSSSSNAGDDKLFK